MKYSENAENKVRKVEEIWNQIERARKKSLDGLAIAVVRVLWTDSYPFPATCWATVTPGSILPEAVDELYN